MKFSQIVVGDASEAPLNFFDVVRATVWQAPWNFRLVFPGAESRILPMILGVLRGVAQPSILELAGHTSTWAGTEVLIRDPIEP
jgi:hypothetical protein